MGSRIKQVLLWVVTVIFSYLIFSPILIVILVINELIRFTLKLFLYCSRSEYELISDGIENLFPTDNISLGGVMLGIIVSPDTSVNIDQEQAHIDKAVFGKLCPNGGKMYERLEKCLGTKWGYGCRRKNGFSIENHVKVWTETTPANQSFYTKYEFFEDIIPRLSKPFDYFSKPGWEWVIIPKVALQLDENDEVLTTVRVFRIHHSYMDAISAGLLITECLMDFNNNSNRPPFAVDPKAKLPRNIEIQKLVQNIKCILQLPYFIMKWFLTSPNSVQDPLFSDNSVGLAHYGVSKKMEFSHVRTIRCKMVAQKNCSRASTTNVLASIVVSAIAQFLDENGKLSNNSALVCGGPTAILPHKNSCPRNQVQFSQMIIPLRRATEVQLVDVTGEERYSTAIRYVLLFLGRFQKNVIQKVLKLPHLKKVQTSTIITSVPGLKSKGFLRCGSLVGDIGGFSVLPTGIGLSVVITSYGEQLRFWCTVDDAVMNKIEFERFLELLTTQKC